jgi:mono/diheme cytochrome c family protein
MRPLFLIRSAIKDTCSLFCQIALFFLAASLATGATRTDSKPWHSPKSCIFTRNPVRATRTSIAAGRNIFMMRCAGCHGRRGHGDGEDASQLRVRPAVLAGAAVQAQSDGALWWKISFGKRPMPGYGFRLSMADRWNVVNYLRTFSREAKPATASLKRN